MDLPRYHRLRPAYYRLEGQQCASCDDVQFPPRSRCRSCGGDELAGRRLSGRGEIYSFTEMTPAPDGFEPPYLLAPVRPHAGPPVAAQLTDIDPQDVAIGTPVEMVTRRLRAHGTRGLLVYGYKFRPMLNGGPPS